MFIFKVEGKIVAKQSTRFTKSGIRYTPRHIMDYAQRVKACFKQAYPCAEPINRAVKVKLQCAFAIPKSFSKKKYLEALEGKIRPCVKPDCDNISKNILDSLNGLAWGDDKQVVELTVQKFYADTEFVIIEIESAEV